MPKINKIMKHKGGFHFCNNKVTFTIYELQRFTVVISTAFLTKATYNDFVIESAMSCSYKGMSITVYPSTAVICFCAYEMPLRGL